MEDIQDAKKRTTFVVDELCQSKHNNVPDMIEQHHTIRRLIELKSYRSSSRIVPIQIGLRKLEIKRAIRELPLVR